MYNHILKLSQLSKYYYSFLGDLHDVWMRLADDMSGKVTDRHSLLINSVYETRLKTVLQNKLLF
jgi:hypothetical protein